VNREAVSKAIQRTLALLVLLAFMYVWHEAPPSGVPGAEVALNLGFLLLAAYVGGVVAKRLGLSRVTGYIVVGLLVGPGALGLLREADLATLGPFNSIAIALIALTAGGELNLRELRGSGRYLTAITLLQTLSILLAVFLAVLALGPRLPFLAGVEFQVVVAVAIMFAAVAVASSPSVAIAVITDTRSRGPVSTTILGVTVLKDVLVIVLFAISVSVVLAMLTPGAGVDPAIAADLAWEVGGSILVGAVAGVAVAGYLKWVRKHLVLFTLGLAWILAEVSAALHVELLLVALSAGFTLENLVPVEGTRFVRALESASLPLYAVFFSLAGAAVHLAELAHLWQWAALLIVIRAVAIWAGTAWGSRVGGAPEPVRRHAWPGFISQAGVALGMVTIVASEFQGWGPDLRDMFVAMVAVHELIGPVAAKWTLDRAGETGKAAMEPAPVPARAAIEALEGGDLR
jgi:Kef-type K+ transport system membrane component KefB